MITTKDLRMVRGQTYPLLFTVKSALGARVDLTGATVHFSVRTDLKAQPIIHKLSPGTGAVVLHRLATHLGSSRFRWLVVTRHRWCQVTTTTMPGL